MAARFRGRCVRGRMDALSGLGYRFQRIDEGKRKVADTTADALISGISAEVRGENAYILALPDPKQGSGQ